MGADWRNVVTAPLSPNLSTYVEADMAPSFMAFSRQFFKASLICFAAMSNIGHALAQERCMPRDQLMAIALQQYHEVTIAAGILNEGAILELLNSGGGETWTLVRTDNKGVSCIVAAGQAWTTVSVPKTGPQT